MPVFDSVEKICRMTPEFDFWPESKNAVVTFLYNAQRHLADQSPVIVDPIGGGNHPDRTAVQLIDACRTLVLYA